MSRVTLVGRLIWSVAALSSLSTAGALFAQQPVFRSGIDTVAVDVQVVDEDGRPLTTLGPDDFDVSINGRRRRVVSASLVRHTEPALPEVMSEAGARPAAGSTVVEDRVFVLAVDTLSFGIADSRAVIAAATGFVEQLGAGDLVGLYTFPTGPRLNPTTDHAAVARRLDTIVGQSDAFRSTYNLSLTEIVDIVAEEMASRSRFGDAAPLDVTRRVMERECQSLTTFQCLEPIQIEARTLALYLEGRMLQGINGLRSLLINLAGAPGRKAVVLLSAGMPVSDRAGGRPDVGEAARTLGQDAARANTVIYSVYIDASYLTSFSSESRRLNVRGQNVGRNQDVMGRVLDQVAGTSGGAMLTVSVGGGEGALARVLRETSSHYLLGVELADTDRTGVPRRLDVDVSRRGVTVRSRQWVVVPKGR